MMMGTTDEHGWTRIFIREAASVIVHPNVSIRVLCGGVALQQRRDFLHVGRAAALLFLLLCTLHAKPQATETTATDSLRKGRAWLVAGGAAAFTVGSLSWLDHAWYQGYPRSAFHFFNDGDEWQQMDKMGHAHSTYQLGRAGHASFRWAGFNKSTSTWLGGSVGLIYLSGIEYLDGLSAEYGFSTWDMTANVAGTALFIGQELGWHDQRILLKWSSHLTDFAPMNPELLGYDRAERMLKDYNGTTVWLSANPRAFGWKAMPAWLNFSAGLGASGMVHATGNPADYRILYLAPDIAFSRIHTRSKLLRTFLFMLDALKRPAPTLEFNGNGGVKGHWVFF